MRKNALNMQQQVELVKCMLGLGISQPHFVLRVNHCFTHDKSNCTDGSDEIKNQQVGNGYVSDKVIYLLFFA